MSFRPIAASHPLVQSWKAPLIIFLMGMLYEPFREMMVLSMIERRLSMTAGVIGSLAMLVVTNICDPNAREVKQTINIS